MYKPNYQISDRLVLNLVKLETEKNSVQLQNLSQQQQSNMQIRAKAINMFHLAHTIGVELTLKDAEKASEGKKVKTLDARGTILNNFRNALEFINSNATETYVDLDVTMLLHLNKIMLTDWKETWEAKFRTGGEQIDTVLDNWITLRDETIEPVTIQDELIRLIDWYRTGAGKIHNIIRIGTVLYRLVRIAPFIVANKLTIFAIAEFLLQKNGYLDRTFLPSTRNLDIYEDEYIEAWSQAIQTSDNSTLWLERFVRNLGHDMSEVKEELQKSIVVETKATKQPFLDLNKRQLKILRYLQTIPTVKREDYVQMMDVSTMTAFRDLDDLVSKKLIKVDGKGRGTRYMLSTR